MRLRWIARLDGRAGRSLEEARKGRTREPGKYTGFLCLYSSAVFPVYRNLIFNLYNEPYITSLIVVIEEVCFTLPSYIYTIRPKT